MVSPLTRLDLGSGCILYDTCTKVIDTCKNKIHPSRPETASEGITHQRRQDAAGAVDAAQDVMGGDISHLEESRMLT